MPWCATTNFPKRAAMSNTPFTFPPPPPPPPRRDTQPAPSFQQPNYPYAQNGRGGGRGSGFGGRGVSTEQHGRGRGDYRGNSSHGGYGRGGNGNPGVYGSNYGPQQHISYVPPARPTNGYASSPDQHYRNDWNHATRGVTAQSHGFHHNGPNGTHFPSAYRPPSRDRQLQNADPSPPSSGGQQAPRKRPYSTAFTKPAVPGPRPQAAPAVPSFNAGIPLSMPAKPAAPPPAKTKKPRKHNQLGLTPASQDHESSSDDENEEATLASKIINNASVLHFDYNGRTATLRTATEVAAWIAERKKRFPTQAKAEAAKKEAAEKKRKWAETKRQREESAQAKRLEQEKVQQEELRLKALDSKKHKAEQKELEKATKAAKDEEDDDEHEITAKEARIKAEKLRLRANVAELKVLEAEAAVRKARKRRASLQSGASTLNDTSAKEVRRTDTDSTIALPEGGDGGVSNMTLEALDWAKANNSAIMGEDDEKDQGEISDSSSQVSYSSALSNVSDTESTSSSGSSASASSSDSDSDSAPEQTTTKRLHPTRVPPPSRRAAGYNSNNNKLCRRLLATGHCSHGSECHYSHDLPDTLPSLGERKGKLKQKRKARLSKTRATDSAAAPVKERRKGLWQVMVEKEEEEARKQILRAIVFMGENGMLGEDGVSDRADAAQAAV